MIVEKIIQDFYLSIEKQQATITAVELPELFANKIRIESVFIYLIINSLNYGGKIITLGYKNNTFFA